MPLNLPIGYMQVAFHHSGDALEGEAICTSAFFIGLASGIQATLDELSLAWSSNFLPLMHSSYRYEKATALTPSEEGPLAFESLIGNNPGTNAGTALPPNVAVLLKKVTGFAGKANRGRMYLPGLTSEGLSATNKALLSAFSLTNYNNAAASFVGDAVLADAPMHLLHQVGIPDPPRQVVDLNPAERVATQRGRLRD